MYSQIFLCALAVAPLVAAHGKISVVTGDLGGNGTALGIKGAVVPGPGPNYLTEVDTTIFWSKDITTDQDIGYTDEAGDNQLANLTQAMELSGSTLPQVSATGGTVNGTWHTVTSDGFGAVQVLVDGTATAKWSTASEAKVTVQVPGNQGNPPDSKKRSLLGHFYGKRATNVNEDYVCIISSLIDSPLNTFPLPPSPKKMSITNTYIFPNPAFRNRNACRYNLHRYHQRPEQPLPRQGL